MGKWILFVGLLGMISYSVRAELAVDFSATTTPDINASCSGRTSGGAAIAFSRTFSHNPTDSWYSGKDSPTFYSGGEIKHLVGDDAYFAAYRVDDLYDETTTIISAGLGAGESAAVVHLWQKADFLNGLDDVEASLHLSMTNAMFATVRNTDNNSQMHLRWVIQEGSSCYISAADAEDFSNTGSHYITLTLADPAAVSWYHYDPARTVLGIGDAATPTFADITALGIYTVFENNDDSQAVLGLQSFSANAMN